MPTLYTFMLTSVNPPKPFKVDERTSQLLLQTFREAPFEDNRRANSWKYSTCTNKLQNKSKLHRPSRKPKQTYFIGFQKESNTTVAFMYLTATYDTIWNEGLQYKLGKLIPFHSIMGLTKNMLLRVISQSAISQERKVRNGLPEGSDLTRCFSAYIF